MTMTMMMMMMIRVIKNEWMSGIRKGRKERKVCRQYIRDVKET